MSRPRISINIGDYLRDTRGLHGHHHGPYLLLIFEYWTHGSLPEDDKSLARIACLNPQEWRGAKPHLMRFFGPNWTHRRIDADLQHFAKKSMKAKVAASVSHSVRKANAIAIATNPQLQRAHAYLQKDSYLPSLQNSEPHARVAQNMPKKEKKAVAVQASEASKPNPTTQEPTMPHNKIPISNELAASLTKPRPPANEDAILREWHAAGLEPRRLANGQLMSLSLWRALQEAQQKPTETSSR